MASYFLIALAIFTQGGKQELEPFYHMLWRTTAEIRGEYLCDSRTGEKQRRKFDALYAKRIEKLKKRYFAWHGSDKKDPDNDIVAGGCYLAKRSFGINSNLNQKLKNFALPLNKIEEMYGSPR